MSSEAARCATPLGSSRPPGAGPPVRAGGFPPARRSTVSVRWASGRGQGV